MAPRPVGAPIGATMLPTPIPATKKKQRKNIATTLVMKAVPLDKKLVIKSGFNADS